MNMEARDQNNPRTWLRDVVQFTVSEFTADPLNMQRAATALSVAYHYHERLFAHLARIGKAPTETLEGFRARLRRSYPAFALVADAANAGVLGLAYSNIVTSGRVLAMLGADGVSVHRAVIIEKQKRQLIPVLEDVMTAYRRVLEENHL